MKLRKGDTVRILTGKSRGTTGKILNVFPAQNRIVVEGVNIIKKHKRPSRQGQTGQIISFPRPISASAAQLLCPSCKKPTRIGYQNVASAKQRMCKSCGTKIDI